MERTEGTLLDAIWSRRYWFFLWMLISAFIAVVIVWAYPPQYRSKAEIYVNTAAPTEPLVEGQFQQPIPEVKRVYHLLTSTQVLDHVIDRVQLIPPHRNGSRSPQARVRARNKLLKQISVKHLDGNAIEIVVTSRDRNHAPRIANLLCKRVITLMGDRARNSITRSKKVHDRVHDGLMAQAARSEARLLRVLDSTRAIPMADERRERLEDLYDRLLAQLARDQQELVNVRKVQQVSAGLLLKEISDPITIIRSADPDLNTDPLFEAIIQVVAFVLFSAILFLVLAVIWLKGQNSLITDWKDFISLEANQQKDVFEERPDAMLRLRKENGSSLLVHGPLTGGKDLPHTHKQDKALEGSR